MPKHKHAELIKAWADDTSLKLQCRAAPAGKFEPMWMDMEEDAPRWEESLEYRIKPKPPVVLAGIEIPKPLTGYLFLGDEYFHVSMVCTDFIPVQSFVNTTNVHKDRIKRGMVHLTEEAAQQHADALNAFHKQLMES